MGKGGFRTAKKDALAGGVKTSGKEALDLCGFLGFCGDAWDQKFELDSDGSFFDDSKEKADCSSEEPRREEEACAMQDRSWEERYWDEMHWEEYYWDQMYYQEEMRYWEEDCYWEEFWEECESWDWALFGKKWQRKCRGLRERRVSRSLKKEKVSPKRFVHFRALETEPKFTRFQPRSVENFLPSRAKKKPDMLQSTISNTPASRRPYMPYQAAPYQPPRSFASGGWEPVPEVILPARPRNQVAQHQANRGRDLGEDLQKALEASVIAAPSGMRYTPEQAARLLIEMQSREITPDDFALLSILDECLQKKTVEEEVLETLPVALWKDLKDKPDRPSSSESSEETCRICLLEYEDADELCTLPCAHLFHKDCIRQWLSNNATTCPLDGREVSC